MISRIASNINFQGYVTIGKNAAHKEEIEENINQIPDKYTGKLIKCKMDTFRKQLADTTPDDANLYIDFEYGKKYSRNSQGDTVFLSVKDADKSDKARPICVSPGTFFFDENERMIDRKETINRIFDFAKDITLWHLENKEKELEGFKLAEEEIKLPEGIFYMDV